MNCTHFHAYLFSGILWFKCVGGCDTIRIYCIMPSARQDDKTFHWENNFKAEFLQRRLYRFWFNSLVRCNSTYDVFHTVFSLNQALFIRCLWRDFQFFDFAYIQWHFHFSEKNLSISEILNFSNSLELNMCKFPMKNLNYKIFTVHSMSTIKSLYSICLFVCKIVWNKLWCRWQKKKNLRPFSLDQ